MNYLDETIKKIQNVALNVSKEECIALINEMEWMEELKTIRTYLPINDEEAGKKIRKILENLECTK